ncbi:hypothetical protein PR048_013102 [Dryococelus australis]|uniref:Endonuclease/exonuclease/phosphatase domain-containing protein n=1 Tax=Dryococelus australis TaxID=614101 RepID=A0ABQ9HR83_9NEOP|nr:hypothetical protein PR048_013102 [Dryococelus australis]
MNTPNKVPLTNISTWNARSVKPHEQEVSEFLQRNNVQIIALTETHLQAGYSFRICNYIIHRRDRPGPHRGRRVALAVHTSIEHQLYQLPELRKLEAVAIKTTIQCQLCIVMPVYAPPGKTITRENLVAFNNSAPTFLALGDLNAKHPSWNYLGKTQNGQLLYHHQQFHPYLVCAPESPTRYPEVANNRPDILNITIYRNINFIYKLEVLQEMHSDHLPLLITPAQVQEYSEQLTQTIQRAIEVAIPLNKITNHQINFPAHITDLIHARNRARKTWHCNRHLIHLKREVDALQK